MADYFRVNARTGLESIAAVHLRGRISLGGKFQAKRRYIRYRLSEAFFGELFSVQAHDC